MAFRFIDACDDKRLHEKIFEPEAQGCHSNQGYHRPIRQAAKGQSCSLHQGHAARSSLSPTERVIDANHRLLKACGAEVAAARPTYKATATSLRIELVCNHCGGAGHLAKVCFSALQGKPKTAQGSWPIRVVADSDSEPKDIWVNRLTLSVSHANGSFNFCTFPDTRSAATLIAADLARRKNVKPTKSSHTKYINVSGDPVPTSGTAPINLSTSGRSTSTSAVITSAIHNEIIVGRDDLKELGVIPKQFPAPIFMVSEGRYADMPEALIRDNPTVLTDELPKGSLDTGCISMKINLTPGERMPFRNLHRCERLCHPFQPPRRSKRWERRATKLSEFLCCPALFGLCHAILFDLWDEEKVVVWAKLMDHLPVVKSCSRISLLSRMPSY